MYKIILAILTTALLSGCTLDPQFYGARSIGSIGGNGWGGALIGGRVATFGDTPKAVNPVAQADVSRSNE